MSRGPGRRSSAYASARALAKRRVDHLVSHLSKRIARRDPLNSTLEIDLPRPYGRACREHVGCGPSDGSSFHQISSARTTAHVLPQHLIHSCLPPFARRLEELDDFRAIACTDSNCFLLADFGRPRTARIGTMARSCSSVRSCVSGSTFAAAVIAASSESVGNLMAGCLDVFDIENEAAAELRETSPNIFDRNGAPLFGTVS